jgi:uncharacterized membrane protein YtjA (UPF0391 family)
VSSKKVRVATLLILKTGRFDGGPRVARGIISGNRKPFSEQKKGVAMLYYALVFLVVALVAGLLGFGFVAFAAAEIARICFFIFIVLFLVSLISHVSRTRLP